MVIYHIISPQDWEAVRTSEFFSVPSLSEEGFIHCCFEDQIDAVIARYYSDREELVILEIDAGSLSSKLVCEPSTGGETYPHVYGPIDVGAVRNAETRRPKAS